MNITYKNTLKLDFNERSDNPPAWLDPITIANSTLWSYPDKSLLEKIICQQLVIDKEQLLITNGGDEAIELLFKSAKINSSDVILPLPAFSQYIQAETSWRLRLNKVDSNDDLTINIDATRRCIKKAKSGDIVIITSPNNPTGETLSLQVIKQLCADAKQAGVIVFLDQAYIEFTEQAQQSLELIDEFNNLIVLRTLSKAYGLAAIRIGYMLGNKQLISNFKNIALPFNNSQPSIDLAKIAFTKKAQLEIISYRKVIAANRKTITNYLQQKQLQLVESEANFILITGNTLKLRLIKAACAKNNIDIKTGLIGLSINQQLDAIRISIPHNIERLTLALKIALEPMLVCFDMDGVLINTQKSYDQSTIETVAFFTGQRISNDEIKQLRNSAGFNNDWKLTRQLIKRRGMKVSLEEVINKFQEYYQGTKKTTGFKLNEIPLIEDRNRQKFFIQKSRTLKTAVVTGRPLAEAKQGLELLGIKNTLLISDDDVINSKPDPEGVIKAKQYYKADSCWLIGDSADDMLAACKAGAIAIGIGDKGLMDFGADLVLESVNQLGELL
ncbi:aminotransferase class I/II-fold pyridoxal phosphate-dependent enzyme [Kangiella sp. TOML190]|uniref:aminotransferase class I/II-fold pyridoxal phosphate-dependent enzyme n=1 Tax=Kangiella sp. TOML190 TaxID=2931351 RepID=UPI0020408292|nr:aminotransferase class I/II-fold pyridoxal phosphate-dependent enzyme [Kangiella sp. TOML190]